MKKQKAAEANTIEAKPSMSLQEMIDAINHSENDKPVVTCNFEADADFVTNRLRAEFVGQVRAVMKEKGIRNGAELARRTGLSRERISKILQEKGNIELRTIARIAAALEAPVAVRIGKRNIDAATSSKPEKTRTVIVHVNRNDYYPGSEQWRHKPAQLKLGGKWETSVSFSSGSNITRN